MLNHIVLMGRLTRDVELRTTQSGVSVASFTLACDRDFGGKDGEGSRVEGSLENSRFLTDQERDKYFPTFTYETLTQSKNDGVPSRAVLKKKGKLEGNWKPGVHALARRQKERGREGLRDPGRF